MALFIMNTLQLAAGYSQVQKAGCRALDAGSIKGELPVNNSRIQRNVSLTFFRNIL